jgi:Methylene-tetrahydromethanopterin dehydrogenase, N-terminal
MKRLLLLLDSDPIPNAYDIIVGYDGGADHIVSYRGITPGNVGPLIDGAVFTRGPSEKKIGWSRERSRPARVRVLLWDRWACEGEREPEAKEVHRHPRRWRSLPALRRSHASPGV